MYEYVDEIKNSLKDAMDLEGEQIDIIPMDIHITKQYEDLIFVKENPETLEEVTEIFSTITMLSRKLSNNDKWYNSMVKLLNNQGYNYGLNIINGECYDITSATIVSLFIYNKYKNPLSHSIESLLFSLEYMLLPYSSPEIKMYLQLMNKLKFRFF